MVGTVEKSIMSTLKHGVRNGFPLLLGQINAGWVVGTGMKQKYRARGCRFERINETVKVQSDGLGVIVRVVNRLDSDVSEDRVVVGYSNISVSHHVS